MSTQANGLGSFLANQALTAFRCVVVSNNGGVTYNVLATMPHGIVEVDAASGDYVPVRFILANLGSMKGTISGACTAGDFLYSAAAGLLHTLSLGTAFTVGVAITTSGNNDQSLIEFIPLR